MSFVEAGWGAARFGVAGEASSGLERSCEVRSGMAGRFGLAVDW